MQLAERKRTRAAMPAPSTAARRVAPASRTHTGVDVRETRETCAALGASGAKAMVVARKIESIVLRFCAFSFSISKEADEAVPPKGDNLRLEWISCSVPASTQQVSASGASKRGA